MLKLSQASCSLTNSVGCAKMLDYLVGSSNKKDTLVYKGVSFRSGNYYAP